jgi:hypothetical protein
MGTMSEPLQWAETEEKSDAWESSFGASTRTAPPAAPSWRHPALGGGPSHCSAACFARSTVR